MAGCSIPGCDDPIKARRLCSAHYQRFRYHGKLDEVAPPDRHPCAHCGELVSGRRWGAVYCSRACNDAARYRRESAALGFAAECCEHCGVSLDGNRGRRDKRYCSDRCSQTARNKRIAADRLAKKLANGPKCVSCLAPTGSKRWVFCSAACKVDGRIARKYRMTVPELHALMESQGRVCAICGTDEWGVKGPQVDHCHAGGHVRGVLCTSCNNGLGRFRDDPARLRAAAAYLERPVS